MLNRTRQKNLWLLWLFIATTAFYVYSSTKLAQVYDTQQAKLANTLMSHISISMSDFIVRNDLLSLNGTIQELVANDPLVEKIRIINPNGQLIAQAGYSEHQALHQKMIQPSAHVQLGSIELWMQTEPLDGQLALFLLWLATSLGLVHLWRIPVAEESSDSETSASDAASQSAQSANNSTQQAVDGASSSGSKESALEQLDQTVTVEAGDQNPAVADPISGETATTNAAHSSQATVDDAESPEEENSLPAPLRVIGQGIIGDTERKLYSQRALLALQQCHRDSLSQAIQLYQAQLIDDQDDGFILHIPFRLSESETTLQAISCVALYHELLSLSLAKHADLLDQECQTQAIIHNLSQDIEAEEQARAFELSQGRRFSLVLQSPLIEWEAVANQIIEETESDISGQCFSHCILDANFEQLIQQQAKKLQ
ncbi:MAG: hypothetical protein SVC26_01565 [Pseudomonadota bacterium]|nr:hypothetical protein [Pseudomonadota bacterium]